MIDENVCLTASTDCLIRQWDLRTPDCVKEYKVGHSDCIYSMKFDNLSMTMASCSATSLNVLDIKMQATKIQFAGDDYAITCLDYLPDKEIIVTGSHKTSDNQGIYIWQFDQPKPIRFDSTEHQHPGTVWRVHCDTQKVVSGSRDGTIKVWDYKDGSLICSEKFIESAVCDVIVTDDQLISTSALGEILVMNFFDPDNSGSSDCVLL